MAGSPVSANGEARGGTADVRNRLLQCAVSLFAERGYAGTSVREICEAAEVTKPTLYYYFQSKRGLAGALIGEAAGTLFDALSQAESADASLADQLKLFARALFKRSREVPHLARFFFESLFMPPGGESVYDLDAMMPEAIGRTKALIASGLGKADAGRDQDAEVAAMVFLGSLQGYVMRFVRKQDVALTADLADRIVTRIVEGLPGAADPGGGAEE